MGVLWQHFELGLIVTPAQTGIQCRYPDSRHRGNDGSPKSRLDKTAVSEYLHGTQRLLSFNSRNVFVSGWLSD